MNVCEALLEMSLYFTESNRDLLGPMASHSVPFFPSYVGQKGKGAKSRADGG